MKKFILVALFLFVPIYSHDFGPTFENIKNSNVAVLSYKKIGQGYVLNKIGSGVIISPSGYIATCAHILNPFDDRKYDGEDVEIGMFDGRSATAKVVLIDASLDLALLKIQKNENLTLPLPKGYFASLGDSNKIIQGSSIYAIGNPDQNFRVVTSGIVSGIKRRRKFDAASNYDGLIQIDNTISSGSSGGAIFNYLGEILGLVAVLSPDQKFGFAIPINALKRLFNDFKAGKKIYRATIGVTLAIPTMDFVKRNGLYGNGKTISGLMISNVLKRSPAYKRLKKGDFIEKINGVPFFNRSQASSILSELRSGEPALLSIVRGGRKMSIIIDPKNGFYDLRRSEIKFRKKRKEEVIEINFPKDMGKEERMSEIGRKQANLMMGFPSIKKERLELSKPNRIQRHFLDVLFSRADNI